MVCPELLELPVTREHPAHKVLLVKQGNPELLVDPVDGEQTDALEQLETLEKNIPGFMWDVHPPALLRFHGNQLPLIANLKFGLKTSKIIAQDLEKIFFV